MGARAALDSRAPLSYRHGTLGLGNAEGQMFLQTVAEKDATGAIAEVYAKEKAGAGFVPEAARCLSTRPDLPPLFDAFFDGIKANFSLERARMVPHHLRRREAPALDLLLAGLFAAACSRSANRRRLCSRSSTAAAPPRLTDKDMAMLAYAEKVTVAADRITQSDTDRLRAFGFTDRNIFDIALCASFRCMLSKLVDATGAVPEPAFQDSDEAFRKAMTVGRPLASASQLSARPSARAGAYSSSPPR